MTEGIIERLARQSLKENKLQLWLNVLLEFDGENAPKVLKSFTRPAKTSDVKKIMTTKKETMKPQKQFTKLEEGGDLFD